MSDGNQLEYEDESESGGQQHVPRESGNELPVKEGAVFGAIAVAVTYLTHLFLTVVASARVTPVVDTSGDAPVATDLVASWTAAGWSYLATFGVGFEAGGVVVSVSDLPNNPAALVNSPFALSTTVMFAVTVGAVMVAGYGIARYTDADDPVEAAKAGLTIVPPYLVFAALAAFVMTHSYSSFETVSGIVGSVEMIQADQFLDGDTVTTDLEVGPSTSDAILFAGIVFPALFAVIGALITQGEDVVDAVIAKVEEQT